MDIKTFFKSILCCLWALGFMLNMSVDAQTKQFSDLEYPYEVSYQQVSGGQQLAYIDEGEGSPVILIHGLGSYIPAWKQNIPALSKTHRVIALDLPGFGKSSKTAEDYTIPFFARTVADLQDSLGIDKAVWVGHSMGGQIALQGALSFPDKIARLVLLAPAGFESFTEQDAALLTAYVTPESIKATPESVVRQTFKATFFEFPEEAAFMADDRIAIRQAEHFDRYARAYAGSVEAMLEGPVLSQLPEITQPALVIFGKQDMLIPNKQLHAGLTTEGVAKAGADKLPDSRLEMVDNAGHFVHFEQSEKVNRLVQNFIKN